MNRLMFVFLLLASGVVCASTPYVDPANGFRLDPPAFEPSNSLGINSQPVTFTGPLLGGHAPSCNVQVQNIGLDSIKYRELSRSQFKAAGLTLEAETDRNVSGKEATLWRYSGAGIRAVALAVFAGDQTFLVTCLSASADFDKFESVFTNTIDSFSLEVK